MSLPPANVMSLVCLQEGDRSDVTGVSGPPARFEVLQRRAGYVLLLAGMPNLAHEMRA